MKSEATPTVKDLVLIGGGHSHVIVLKRFGMNPMPGVRITVICREVDTPYSGMLPGFVAGHYGFDDVHIDLGPLCRFAGARLYHDEVDGIDLTAKEVQCVNHPPIPYDVVSIDVGATPCLDGVDIRAQHVVPVKPISSFVVRWQALLARVLASDSSMALGVVGAGAGGTEMVLAMQHGLTQQLRDCGGHPERLSFHLFSAGEVPLETHPARVQRRFLQVLDERAIKFHPGARITGVEKDRVTTSEGKTHVVDELLWVTQASAQSWLRRCGLAVDSKGFVAVNATLESTSHRDVFAAGDCASVVEYPREKAGVFAVRQGKPLERNLRRALTARALIPYAPQRQFLSLISTGDTHAIASRGSLVNLEGPLVWRWKDWIDRRFMNKFSSLPQMSTSSELALSPGLADATAMQALSGVAMRCGGCGAKVGASVLDRVMSEWQQPVREEILVGLTEPDDAAVIKVPPGKLLVQSVDSFRAMLDDPFVFGKIAANHALGDLYAMGAEPHSALAIVTLAFAPERKLEDDLRQVMAGAMSVLEVAGATLLGGHTSEGGELSVGFAVNGFIDEDLLMRKQGLVAGDALILTKAIGTGTLFAADMRGKARGRWITEALRSMVQSNHAAAMCLRRHGAKSCTDITGFGLLGHLVEMVKASAVDAELYLSAIPLLAGALETVNAGITSSLQPQNLRLRRAIKDLDRISAEQHFPLLFDPQTAGGLLAGVPQSQLTECLAELRHLGYDDSACIGRVEAQSDELSPIKVKIG